MGFDPAIPIHAAKSRPSNVLLDSRVFAFILEIALAIVGNPCQNLQIPGKPRQRVFRG